MWVYAVGGEGGSGGGDEVVVSVLAGHERFLRLAIALEDPEGK